MRWLWASPVGWIGLGCLYSGAQPAVLLVEGERMVLRVSCEPPQAEVLVDGVLQGTCALLGKPDASLNLPAGTHELLVTADGFRTYRSELSARGMGQSVTIHLQPRGNLKE